MARKKTSKGVTDKSTDKLTAVITMMIGGMRPEQFKIWMEAGGFDISRAVAIGVARWNVKQSIASAVYHASIKQITARFPEINYAARYMVRSLGKI